MKKNKIAAVVLAAAMSAATFAGCAVPEASMKASPYDYVKYSAAKTVMEISKQEPTGILAQAAASLKNGTTAVESGNFSAELYSNTAKNQYALDCKLEGGGNNVSGGATVDKNKIVLFANSQNCDAAYAIVYKDFAAKLKKSIFSPTSKSSYSLPQDEFDSLISAVENIEKLTNGKPTDGKLIAEIVENEIRMLEPKTSSGTYETNGVKINANIVSYKLTSKELATFITNCCSDIQKDKNISYSTREAINDYELDSLCSELYKENFDIDLSFYINSKTNTLTEACLKLNYYEKGKNAANLTASLFLGADASDYNGFNAYVKLVENDDEAVKITVKDVVTDAKASYTEKLTAKITEDSESISIPMSFNFDKSNGDYSAKITIPEEFTGKKSTAAIYGKVTKGDSSASISFDKIIVDKETQKLGVVVTFGQGGKFKTMKSVSLTSVSEKPLKTKLDALSDDISAVTLKSNGALGEYERKSAYSLARSNARLVTIAVNSVLANASADGDKITTEILCNTEDGNMNFKGVDLTNYLGKDFNGYIYAPIDLKNYSVKFVVWSDTPIPKNYRKILTQEQCISYCLETGHSIGSYPNK